MPLRTVIPRIMKTNSRWYLAVGVLSLLKALAVRHDQRRLRRELLDASLFLGIGILLRKIEARQAKDSTARSILRTFQSKTPEGSSLSEQIRQHVPRRRQESPDSFRQRLSR